MQRVKYINNVCIAFVTLCHYNMYYMYTDANRPEKKDASVKNLCILHG